MLLVVSFESSNPSYPKRSTKEKLVFPDEAVMGRATDEPFRQVLAAATFLRNREPRNGRGV